MPWEPWRADRPAKVPIAEATGTTQAQAVWQLSPIETGPQNLPRIEILAFSGAPTLAWWVAWALGK